jgi:hypothetical protein
MARKKSAEELEDEEGGATMDYGEEPDFSDPEDFVDNITDEVSSSYAGSSVADPGSGAFLTPGSGMGKMSGSGMNNSDHISESLITIFWVKILQLFDADPGSGIR